MCGTSSANPRRSSTMKASLSETSLKLLEFVHSWAPEGIIPEELDEHGVTPRMVEDLANAGLLGMGVPSALGGLELPVFDIQQVLRSLAAADISVAIYVLDTVLAASTTRGYQDASRRDTVLSGISNGTILTAVGITEKAAGSNPRGIKSLATPTVSNGEGSCSWKLNGDKRWIGNASSAQVLHLFVQLQGPDGNPAGLTGFTVDANSPGLTIEPAADMLGLKAFPKNTIHMEDVVAKEENLIGALGEGMETASKTFHLIRLLLGGMAVGTMKRCIQLMHRYASQRTISTGVLLDNPVTRRVLTDVIARIDCLNALSDAVARSWDAQDAIPDEVFMIVKNAGAESLGIVVDQAIQMLGARGYDEINGLARFYRDARPFRIFEGPTETLDMHIGVSVVENPHGLNAYLEDHLDAPDLAEQLVAAGQAFAKSYKHSPQLSGSAASYQAYSDAGKLAVLTLQLAAVRQLSSSSAAWASAQVYEFRDRVLRSTRRGAPLMEQLTLARMVHEFDNELPEVLPYLARSPSTVDPLLAPKQEQTFTSIMDEIYAHADVRPTHVALEQENKQLTYQELKKQIQPIAHDLVDCGVRKGDRVAGIVLRSMDAIVAMLAVYHVGGVWVPIDPSYPADRRDFILDDANAKVLLTNTTADIGSGGPVVVKVSDCYMKSSLKSRPGGLAHAVMGATELAYIIYTSGSSGKPKGCCIEQQGLSHFSHAARQMYEVTDKDRVLQFSSLSFDTSVEEIFPCLSAGGTLVLRTDSMLGTATHFLSKIEEARISLLDLPTAYWHGMVKDLAGCGVGMPDCIRMVIIGGERCLPERWEQWKKIVGPTPVLMNTYGPTETTVVATAANLSTLSHHTEPPIGLALPGVRCHILDSALHPVAYGDTGELYIGGNGLARGYLNQPEKTKASFVFLQSESRSVTERVYRTGDLVRQSPDGHLIFQGRVDRQVKVSGYRIDLGEVEHSLLALDFVSNAAILTERDDHNALQMVAHVESPSATKAQIRSELRKKFPSFMIPSRFVIVSTLRLTTGGKVDRNALRTPESPTTVMPIVPESINEKSIHPPRLVDQLLKVWHELLGPKATADDDYLMAGGNSLLAVQLAIRIRDSTGKEVSIADIFRAGTLNKLVVSLESVAKPVQKPSILLRKASRGQSLPLSYGQQQIWIHHTLFPAQPLYNEPCVLFLPEPVDAGSLEKAFFALIERHEILRVSFTSRLGEPVQSSSDQFTFKMKILTTQHWESVKNVAEAFVRKPFELDRPPLLRAMLVKTKEPFARLVLSIHHLVVDGVSFYGVLLPELQDLYEALTSQSPVELAGVTWQFLDYASWQTGQGINEKEVEWWKARLAGVSELQLPTDLTRPAHFTSSGESFPIDFGADRSTQMIDMAREQGVTPFGFLTTCLSILLQRYTNQDDIVVGTVINTNRHAEFEGTLGYFDNTLLLRNEIHREISFSEQLQRVHENILDCFGHSDTPFSKIDAAVRPVGSTESSPFMRVMLIMEPPATERVGSKRWRHSRSELSTGASKFELMFELEEYPDGFRGRVEFSDELFELHTIQRVVRHLLKLVDGCCSRPHESVGNLELIGDDEKKLLKNRRGSARNSYLTTPSVVSLLESSGNLHADRVACRFEDEAIAYGELTERSWQLAHYLRSQGVAAGNLVGIFIGRGFHLIVGILGILKAGGAYVPLDPSYPADRRRMMLEDSAVTVVLTDDFTQATSAFEYDGAPFVSMDRIPWEELRTTPSLQYLPSSADLCYVIYTSGSTGRPKGVEMAHQALLNLIFTQLRQSDADETTITLQYSPISFDVSFQEIFSTLASGGELVLVSEEDRRDSHRLADILAKYNVQRMFMPVVALRQLADAVLHGATTPHALREVIVAGEQLLVNKSVRELFRKLPGASLHNHYGPSETHVVTTKSLTGDPMLWPTKPSIGRPIQNTKVLILDKEMRPVPDGIPGEIYIGGAALADGYRRRPTLTKERFLSKDQTGISGRLYKTGDVGRVNNRGSIVFEGRSDTQVKLRGYRIELGEIETTLTNHPSVREAVADVITMPGSRQDLVSWVVEASSSSIAFDEKLLRDELAKRLPEYMVPRTIVRTDSIPLTPSGKVARTLLPKPTIDSVPTRLQVARDDVELRMVQVWSEVLQLPQKNIRVQDSFFHLGGSSLMAVALMARIEQTFGLRLGSAELTSNRTLEALASRVRQCLRESKVWSPVVPVQEKGWNRPIFCAPGSGGNVLGEEGNLDFCWDVFSICVLSSDLCFNL